MTYTPIERKAIEIEIGEIVEPIAEEISIRLKNILINDIVENTIDKILYNDYETIDTKEIQLRAIEILRNEFLGESLLNINHSKFRGNLWSLEDSIINDPEWKAEHRD